MYSEEKLNALRLKVNEKLSQYRKWLLTQTPETIVASTPDYAARINAAAAIQKARLREDQADVLLGMEHPLAAVCEEVKKHGESHIAIDVQTAFSFANQELQKTDAYRETTRRIPVYPHSQQYAVEHNEQDQYVASYRANVACRDAMEAAIDRNYDGGHFDSKAAVKEVEKTFGFDRMLHICAHSIRENEWDGRLSSENIAWERSMNLSDDVDTSGRKHQNDYTMNQAHKGLINLFAKELRHEHLLTQPLTRQEIVSEADRLNLVLRSCLESNQPKGAHFMAKLAPDFVQRAGTKEMDALKKLITFKSVDLTPLKDRPGIFALIPKNTDRSILNPRPRASVLDRLDTPKRAPSQKAPKMKHDMER